MPGQRVDPNYETGQLLSIKHSLLARQMPMKLTGVLEEKPEKRRGTEKSAI